VAGSSFYDQIAANRRNSFLLAAFVVALLALLGFLIGYALFGTPGGGIATLIGATALGGLSASFTYAAGDSLVLAVSGARQVDEKQAPQLMNVVSEMAIAANVPMPRVYIIDDTAPNAFATGRDPEHASVAITTGLLQKLDREELQGVIGHEMSHVRNFDIRFSLVVGVMVGVIAILADFFLRFTFWSGVTGGRRGGDRDSGGSGAQAIIFIAALILAILAPLISRFIQLAVSRQREYLADASSVELTRNPHGLERALAKISADQEVLEVANRGTQHMYFTNPIKKFEERSSGLMSTHPPILDRINRLRELTGDPPLGGAEATQLAGLD
jgi:heat shock protein HtpX